MVFDNLPGIFHEKQDGGLNILTTSNAPRVLVLGTASNGISDTPYVVGRAQEAAVEFGSGGTLTRGMYEVKSAGAENVILMRIGAIAAKIEHVGGTTGGITITTSDKDLTAGDLYEFYWEDSTDHLVIYDVATSGIVYERTWPAAATIDLGVVYVTGTPEAGGTDVGTPSALVTLTDANGIGAITYTAGSDGTGVTAPSRMKLYEELYKAYALLENERFDFVVPMDVYLDDSNVADGFNPTISGNTYPVAGDPHDGLLYFYTEEYQGEQYFWWREVKASGAADLGPAGKLSTSWLGVDLTNTTFNTVSFGYQLANFCYNISRDSNECHGSIGVKPPASLGLKDASNWIGKLPVYTTDSDGDVTIASALDNGTGLLGNKFMGGKYGYRAGVGYGGFIATDTGFEDGTDLEDRGGEVIDIGQYISVVGDWVTLFNAFDSTGLGYVTTLAPSYIGFVSSLDPKSAPTNKEMPGVRKPFRINNTKLDQLAGVRYVMCNVKPKGIVIADAPTAALPTSDYRRLTTVRIVKQIVDSIRSAGEPFIGEAGGDLQRAALETACQQVMQRLLQTGYVTRYELAVSQTAAERVNGDATIELVLVPAFELRQITLVISLQPV